jgi:hypothetical protein
MLPAVSEAGVLAKMADPKTLARSFTPYILRRRVLAEPDEF